MTQLSLHDRALAYHAQTHGTANVPGKIGTSITKPVNGMEDLALAYSPGVAEVCTEIAEHPAAAALYTNRPNRVAVISNGTAVLGLGDIGALASKPVMEGKCVLLKKFANIDGIDLEVDETDIQNFVDTVARLEPSFGGINLEDIKAPACFAIEEKLKERCNIPVMHDDQHGTAIVVLAALMNALTLSGKNKEDLKVVCVGAGAAGFACMQLLVNWGVPIENIILVDSKGVVRTNRSAPIRAYLAPYAAERPEATLDDAINGADVFVGVSAPKLLTQDMVKRMADKPIIFAMANPEPEIRPELAKEACGDCIVGTGRSDYPNMVNNSVAFPYVFRGALDCGAVQISEGMKTAAAHAIAELGRNDADYGPEKLIPTSLDDRLLPTVSAAVAQAAAKEGLAQRPIKDLANYKKRLVEMMA